MSPQGDVLHLTAVLHIWRKTIQEGGIHGKCKRFTPKRCDIMKVDISIEACNDSLFIPTFKWCVQQQSLSRQAVVVGGGGQHLCPYHMSRQTGRWSLQGNSLWSSGCLVNHPPDGEWNVVQKQLDMCIQRFREGQIQLTCKGYTAVQVHLVWYIIVLICICLFVYILSILLHGGHRRLWPDVGTGRNDGEAAHAA